MGRTVPQITLKDFVNAWQGCYSVEQVEAILPELDKQIILLVAETLVNRGIPLQKFERCYPWEI